MVTRSWLLAVLFQRLGYVGRCSFDLLVVGESLATARAEFLECNGRWGGTSGPMMLMNRLFGDWATRPYATMECRAALAGPPAAHRRPGGAQGPTCTTDAPAGAG